MNLSLNTTKIQIRVSPFIRTIQTGLCIKKGILENNEIKDILDKKIYVYYLIREIIHPNLFDDVPIKFLNYILKTSLFKKTFDKENLELIDRKEKKDWKNEMENIPESRERITELFKDLKKEFHNSDNDNLILLVSHSGLMDQVNKLFGIGKLHRLYNCSVFIFDISDNVQTVSDDDKGHSTEVMKYGKFVDYFSSLK